MDRVEREIGGLAGEVRSATAGMSRSWDSVSIAVTGFNQALEIGQRVAGAFSSALDYMGETGQQIKESLDLLAGTVGSLLVQAFSTSTGGSNSFADAIRDLSTEIADADSEIGRFTRDTISALVEGFALVASAAIRVVESITFIVDSFRMAFQGILTAYNVILEAVGGTQSLEAEQALQELQNQRVFAVRMLEGAIGGPIEDVYRDQIAAIDRQMEAQRRIANQAAAAASAQSRITDMTRESLQESMRSAEQNQLALQDTRQDIQNWVDRVNRNLEQDVQMGVEGEAGGIGLEGRLSRFRTMVGLMASDNEEIEESVRRVARSNQEAGESTNWLADQIRDLLGVMQDYKFQAQEIKTFEVIESEKTGPEMFPVEAFRERLREAIEAGEFQVEPDTMLQPFEQLQVGVTSSLNQTFSAIGAFVSGTRGAFESLGVAIKNTFANTFSSIGSAFLQGAVSAAISGSGPLGVLLGLGAMFSLIGGLLTGGGGTASMSSAGRTTAQTADVLQSIRPEVAGSGGATVHYHQHIGVQFSDPDRSARAVASLAQRARRMGEL
jgi:hypothetical protein